MRKTPRLADRLAHAPRSRRRGAVAGIRRARVARHPAHLAGAGRSGAGRHDPGPRPGGGRGGALVEGGPGGSRRVEAAPSRAGGPSSTRRPGRSARSTRDGSCSPWPRASNSSTPSCPYGAPLQRTSSPETIDAIFREGKPIVSDLIWGQNAQRYLVAVAVPVVRGGKVVNCLTLNFSPDRLTQLLLRQQFPASWVAAINDRTRRVVARSVLADARVGKPVVEWLAAATRAAESGIATGPMMDGRPGQIAFQRLQEVPWVVALAVPVAELQSAAPIWGFISAGAILSLVAVGMAVYMGRKITRPVRSLARASGGLLRGDAGDLGSPTRFGRWRNSSTRLSKRQPLSERTPRNASGPRRLSDKPTRPSKCESRSGRRPSRAPMRRSGLRMRASRRRSRSANAPRRKPEPCPIPLRETRPVLRTECEGAHLSPTRPVRRPRPVECGGRQPGNRPVAGDCRTR